MMLGRREEAARRCGFEDALAIGRPNPLQQSAKERVAYDRGFAKGKRAVDGVVALARGERLKPETADALFDQARFEHLVEKCLEVTRSRDASPAVLREAIRKALAEVDALPEAPDTK